MLFPWQRVALFCSLLSCISLYTHAKDIPLIHQPLNYGVQFNTAYLEFNQQNQWLSEIELNSHHNENSSSLAYIPDNKLFYDFSFGYVSAQAGHDKQVSESISTHQFYLRGGVTIFQYQKFDLLIDAQHLHQDNLSWQLPNVQAEITPSSYNKFTQVSLLGQYNINTNWQVIGGFSTNNYSMGIGTNYDFSENSDNDTKAVISTRYQF